MLAGCTPWPEEFQKLYRAKEYWEDRTLYEVLEDSIKKYPSKAALIYNNERYTYAELGEKINNLASNLVKTGLKPLDRVVLQLPNIPQFVFAYYAMVKIGVIPIMALPAHRKTEIGHFIKFSGARAYFAPDQYRKFDYREMAEEIRAEAACLEYVFVVGEPQPGQIGLDELLEKPAEDEEVKAFLSGFRPDPCEVTLMLLSGGTTAMPKLIPRTHNDYVLNSKASGVVAGFSEDTVYLAILPIAHNFALGSPGLQAAFFNGGTVVLSPGTDEETVWPIIEKEKVTVTSIATSLVNMWLNSPILGKYDLGSLKVIQTGGAKLPGNLRQRLMEEFHCICQEVFGTGEGLLNLTRLNDEEEHLLNSSGAPVCEDDEIKVIDENGNELPDGEAGELIVRGPYTIRGYYNVPETNAHAFTKEGFYRMGDVVRKFGRYIYSEGRIKDLINRGGEKISCEEVEGFISAHPKVKSCCLVAMPDEVYGEKGCAYVIPRPGEMLTFKELIDFLLTKGIAKFKLPERLEIVDSFPLSNVGKILKRTLREQIAAKLAEEKEAAGKGNV